MRWRNFFNGVPKLTPLGGIFPLKISAHSLSLNREEGGLGLGGWGPLSPSVSGGLLCTFFLQAHLRQICIVFFLRAKSALHWRSTGFFQEFQAAQVVFTLVVHRHFVCMCVQGRGGFTLVWRGQRGSTRGVTKVHLCSSYNRNLSEHDSCTEKLLQKETALSG